MEPVKLGGHIGKNKKVLHHTVRVRFLALASITTESGTHLNLETYVEAAINNARGAL